MKFSSPYITAAKSVSRFSVTLSAVFFTVFLFLCGEPATAASDKTVESDSYIWTRSDRVESQDSLRNANREAIFNSLKGNLAFSHFTWGAEVGASIDLTAHDMSTFNVDAVLGYKNKWLKTLGIGVGIHRSVKSGDNFIPIYALVRTSFTPRPSICFFHARVGYSFNTIGDSPTFGDLVSDIGCGVNLSSSRMAKTYIIAGVGYRYFNQRHIDQVAKIDTHYVFMAQLQFGVNF